MIHYGSFVRNPPPGRKLEPGMLNKGDFTADFRLIWLSTLAIPVGALCAVVALVLQRLIGFFTNFFYYHSLTIPSELVAVSFLSAALGEKPFLDRLAVS